MNIQNQWVDLYEVRNLPVFQNRIYDTREEALLCQRGHVTLAQDPKSGLVHNRTFRPELVVYDSHYQNEQAISKAFQVHLDAVTVLVKKHFRGKTILEVGCGKGHFLSRLRDEGFDARGIDPSYEGDDPAIVKEYFTTSSGLRAQGLVLRHVLEHVEDPYNFLLNLRDSNGGSGKIYIEVPALEWILANRAWFDIYYEHVNYFRLRDFEKLFTHIEHGSYLFGGQYLGIVANLEDLRPPDANVVDPLSFPDDFTATLSDHARQIIDRGPDRSLVWGAASKGVIFSLHMQRQGATVGSVVDINPAKQGKYLPALGLRVLPPDVALASCSSDADIYIMNSIYADEIRAATGHRFNYYTVETA